MHGRRDFINTRILDRMNRSANHIHLSRLRNGSARAGLRRIVNRLSRATCLLSVFPMLFFSCVESVELEEQRTPDLLVIEASLTDELKNQQVRLTRSFGFETDSVPPETQAQVVVETDQEEAFTFRHSGNGIYISDRIFAVESGRTYELVIEAADGTIYRSSQERLPGTARIDNLYAERQPNDNGTDGVFIYLDGTPQTEGALYYRYEYEETYKIIAPDWTPQDFLLTDYDPCANPIEYNLEIVPRTEEQQTCYKTVPSTRVLQNDVTTLANPEIRRYPVRFLGATDFMISHRYSILVRQFVHSAKAFSYFQSLNDFSDSESVFNSVQPGFLSGNIEAINRSEAPVIGFFEVASVREERLFFSFEELFPDLEKPPFITNCVPTSSPEAHPSFCAPMPPNPCPQSIVEFVNLGLIAYISPNDEGLGACPGTYAYVKRECGDCTVLGSNEVPEFWIE
ncbi:MAG: DUF4249 domain-containing protein [Robiginitalea sp.]|uniref:DUF4249 domain-containing protein n=1 Tax=Robiginitalea sp. TaxID=1902411 RepID=UPI003C72A863